ncbi:phosphoenolpyruvate carboxykinase (GTP), partial [Streptomyces sp. NP160]
MTTTDIETIGGTTHKGLAAWVAEVAEMTTPDRIQWVTGSDEEWKQITDKLVETGTFTRLNED